MVASKFLAWLGVPQAQVWGEVGCGTGALTAAMLAVRAIEIPTIFRDFNDFWLPFLGRQGAAPTYLATVDSTTRAHIRELLRARVATNNEGAITLAARAWAIQGLV